MPTVDNHIATLLQEHDCVIIPDFGGLITQYTPVRIHPVRHSMAPPSKKIAFNEKLKLNDGRLVDFISIQEQLSQTDAATRVQAFVAAVNLALDRHQRYQLQDIGLFRKEPGQPIEFEYEAKINLLAESFGLPEVFSRPVLRARSLEEIRTVVHEKVAIPLQAELQGPKNTTWWQKTMRYAALVPIVLLSASAIYLASTLDHGLNMSNLNPVSLIIDSLPEKPWQEKAVSTQQAGEDVPQQVIISFDENQEAPVSSSSPAFATINREITDLEREQYYYTLVPQKTVPTAYLTDQFLSQEKTGTTVEEVKQSADNFNDGWDIPAEPVFEAATAKPVAEARPEKAILKTEKAVVTAETLTQKTGRFYIVAGGFTSEANATKLQKKLIADGLTSKIIAPGKESRLNRVTINEFETREEALSQLPELTPTYGKALWVLEY